MLTVVIRFVRLFVPSNPLKLVYSEGARNSKSPVCLVSGIFGEATVHEMDIFTGFFFFYTKDWETIMRVVFLLDIAVEIDFLNIYMISTTSPFLFCCLYYVEETFKIFLKGTDTPCRFGLMLWNSTKPSLGAQIEANQCYRSLVMA